MRNKVVCVACGVGDAASQGLGNTHPAASTGGLQVDGPGASSTTRRSPAPASSRARGGGPAQRVDRSTSSRSRWGDIERGGRVCPARQESGNVAMTHAHTFTLTHATHGCVPSSELVSSKMAGAAPPRMRGPEMGWSPHNHLCTRASTPARTIVNDKTSSPHTSTVASNVAVANTAARHAMHLCGLGITPADDAGRSVNTDSAPPPQALVAEQQECRDGTASQKALALPACPDAPHTSPQRGSNGSTSGTPSTMSVRPGASHATSPAGVGGAPVGDPARGPSPCMSSPPPAYGAALRQQGSRAEGVPRLNAGTMSHLP